MIIVYGIFIGAAILSLLWGLTAKPPAARANLMAGLDLPEARPKASPLVGLGRAARRFLPTGYIKSLDTNLVQAAHPWRLDMSRLLGVKLACALFPILLATATGYPLVGLVVAVGAFFLPDYAVFSERDKRQTLMSDAASNTIDQLTIVVEAGLGFDAALQRVATTTEGPLALELQRTVEDMRAGMPRDQALRALAERTRLPEIRQLVSALIQAQRHGVALADTLRIQAHELRDKRVQAVEEKASKFSTKMIFPIVFCFMPVFFIMILVPAFSGLSQAFS